MTLTLPALPFSQDALAPFISPETLEFHHGKHHAAYVANANNILENEPSMAGKSLEEIIHLSANENIGLFNNAAQHWNHSFYWNCIKPNGGGTKLPSALQEKIDSDLGGYETFKQEFVQACVTQFGSGWGWLTKDEKTGKLEITKTSNAGVPFIDGKKPLLTCDVWEHAYYIDYRNARPKYIETFVDSLINWEFVESQL